MKKALIIGSKGNLGTQINQIFKSSYDLTCLNREDVNLLDKDEVFKKIKELRPSVILNTSAYNNVDNCENNDCEYNIATAINSDLPGKLADIAIEIDAVLVHFSTDYVFNGSIKQPEFIETDLSNPINKYGETKKIGEDNIIKSTSDGLRYYIIRTSKLFGPIGESKNSKPSFFDIMLKLAKEKDTLDIVDEEISSFTYTPDLAEHTKKLLDSNKEFGIYHFTNQGAITWYKAAEILFKLSGDRIRLNPVTSSKFPRPARRSKASVLKNTKFDNMRNWEEALEEYLLSKNENI